MKRQQLEKLKGKKFAGGYGPARGRSHGGAAGASGNATKEGKVPIAVRLIQGLGKK